MIFNEDKQGGQNLTPKKSPQEKFTNSLSNKTDINSQSKLPEQSPLVF
jgi:hypothetical protein